MRDSLIVLSGGMDSVTLLYEQKDRIALALSFDYGSNHNAREIECARWHCNHLGVEHIVISLGFMGQYFESSLLSGADDIPSGDYADSNMKSTVVPFRNGIMLSVACGLAESRKLNRVLIASHGGDHAIYPDCRAGFVKAMGEAMKAGTYLGVSLEAPYTDIDKAEICRRGASFDLDYSHTYSCYCGGEHHCGTCGTCRERKEAFIKAGVKDPTIYD